MFLKMFFALLAQLVEQLPLKEMVGGSIPSRGTMIIVKSLFWEIGCFDGPPPQVNRSLAIKSE